MGVAEDEGVWSEELSLRVEGGEKLKAIGDKALEHFKTLQDLSPSPSYSMDSFVKVHSKVTISVGVRKYEHNLNESTRRRPLCDLHAQSPAAQGTQRPTDRFKEEHQHASSEVCMEFDACVQWKLPTQSL